MMMQKTKMKIQMKRSNERIPVPVYINPNASDGCGLCAVICPGQVFEMKEISTREINELSFFGRLKVRIKGNVKA